MDAWRVLAHEDVVLHGCSRLDAQVHAESYVLNFHTASALTCDRIIKGLNGIFHAMQMQISVYDCQFVESHFHARFHAVGKHYRYLIWHGKRENALWTNRCWHVHSPKSLVELQDIFSQFQGEHDFAAYRASDCGAKTTVRHVHRIHVSCHPRFPELKIIDIFGDGFLKNMIRNMVGTAVEVALGKKEKNTITDSFKHRNRTLTGVCAPAHALTLLKVYYEKDTFDKEKTNIGIG